MNKYKVFEAEIVEITWKCGNCRKQHVDIFVDGAICEKCGAPNNVISDSFDFENEEDLIDSELKLR